MPFTPYHMGPGLAVKFIAGKRFSLTVFGVSQIAMDLEPLYRILHHDRVVHGLSHTYLGAVVIALLVFWPAQKVCPILVKMWNSLLSRVGLARFAEDHKISWRIALASALIGTLSHVLIDGFYHLDMMPLWPFSRTNALLNLMSEPTMRFVCVVSGVIGLAGWLVVTLKRRRA